MSENKFEQDLNPEGIKNLNQEIYELEKLKWNTVSQYISREKEQKTELTKQERLILPLLEIIAERPYNISEKIKYDKNNPFHIKKECDKIKRKCEPMRLFLDHYYKMGIAVDRKGRSEEKDVLTASLGNNTSLNTLNSNTVEKNILMK